MPAIAGKAVRRSVFLAFEVNGEDLHVGAVCGIDGVVQRFLAAAVRAVREDDERLAP
jgi:hypothetical protein